MARKLVTIYPLPGAWIPGVPHVEQEVTQDEAERLLKFHPPAFTTDPPAKADEPAAAGKPDEGEPEAQE